MKLRFFTAIGLLVVATAMHAFAATLTLGTLTDVADTLASGVVTSLGYLFFTLAVVAFFWGIVQFIWAVRSGDAGDGVKNGKQFMVWGLIALFVMFSVWGIIQFAQEVLGIRGQTAIVIPQIELLGAPSGARPSTEAEKGTPSPTSDKKPGGTCTATVNGVRYTGTYNDKLDCVKTSDKKPGGSCKGTLNGTEFSGTYDASLNCIKGDDICLAQGPGTGCTTKYAKIGNNDGATVSGTCNNLNQCVPSQSGGFAKLGEGCRYGGDCADGLTCDPDRVCRTVRGGACTKDPNCTQGTVCTSENVCDTVAEP